ncbi:MAG: nucleotide sugar dehydrogenase [Parcubacteria group bacterium]|nr:nucleotide sugar dehydrogenase [Parcubacteria group bacterium]
MTSNNIAVIGLWHLGEVFSVGLAELGHKVVGIDKNEEIVKKFNSGILPLAEPNLGDLLKKNISEQRLSFSNNYSCINKCDTVWITEDTPVNDLDEVDVSSIKQLVLSVSPYLKDGVFLVFSSQLPVGTCHEFSKLILEARPSLKFNLAYVPENLQLGHAVKSFFEPGRIVIGAEDENVFQKIEYIFKPICSNFLRMNLASAEMSKHALNSFLAASLTFTYDIADMCELVGADILDVSRALRSDLRIGQAAYLDASVGFSGGTLGRDLKVLLSKARGLGVELPVVRNVFEKNFNRKNLVIKKLENFLGNLNGKKIGILGVTYKVGTSTLRRSLALEIAGGLKERGADVCAADPMAVESEVLSSGVDKFSNKPEETIKGCVAVLLMTAWPEFKNLDPKILGGIMRSPKVFFDTRNFLNEKADDFLENGIKYLGIGRGKYAN